MDIKPYISKISAWDEDAINSSIDENLERHIFIYFECFERDLPYREAKTKHMK